MNLIMDGLLMAGTLFAGLYCWVLSGRVRDLKNLDDGLGASIVTLTRQIELARTTLDEARAGAKENRSELEKLIGQAENSSGRLKMLLSAGRDSIERQRLAAQEHRTVMEAADLALVAARSLHPAPQERSSHRETLAPRPAPRDARPTPEPGSYAAGRGDEDDDDARDAHAAPPARMATAPPAQRRPLTAQRPFVAPDRSQSDARTGARRTDRDHAADAAEPAPDHDETTLAARKEAPSPAVPQPQPTRLRPADPVVGLSRDPAYDVPKPRLQLAPSTRLAGPPPVPRSEDELLEALSSIAAGVAR